MQNKMLHLWSSSLSVTDSLSRTLVDDDDNDAVGLGGGGVYGSSPPPPPPPPPQDEIKKIITAKYEKLVNLYSCILPP